MPINQCPSRTHFRALMALALVLAASGGGLSAGCRTAVVRVPVSPENIRLANAAAIEGEAAIGRKDYYAGLIKYLEASRYNPNSEYIFNKVGICYSRLQYFGDAITAFNRSIGLNPKYAYSYNNLGSVYFASDNRKKAESYFRKAISLNGNEASFHINLGTLYFENGKYEKGLEELRRALRLDPEIMKRSEGAGLAAATNQKNTAEKNYFMARVYASTGNAERAVENLELALKEGFTNLDALLKENDFDPIRKNEKFIEFMKQARQLLGPEKKLAVPAVSVPR